MTSQAAALNSPPEAAILTRGLPAPGWVRSASSLTVPQSVPLVQVAQRWALAESTVRALGRSGQLATFRMGAKLLHVPVASLLRMENPRIDIDGACLDGLADLWFVTALPLLSIAEAAQLLRCGEPTVRAIAKSGDVLAHRLGPKIIKIPRVELDRYLQEKISSCRSPIVSSSIGKNMPSPTGMRTAGRFATRWARMI